MPLRTGTQPTDLSSWQCTMEVPGIVDAPGWRKRILLIGLVAFEVVLEVIISTVTASSTGDPAIQTRVPRARTMMTSSMQLIGKGCTELKSITYLICINLMSDR